LQCNQEFGMKPILAALLCSTICGSAFGATIRDEGSSSGLHGISITGEIVPGDADQFDEIAKQLVGQKTVVMLSSPGGTVIDGLNIGLTIHQLKFATWVPANQRCASICGDIWLAGQIRFLERTSKVGFHAAYRASDGAESGRANALVGAYLTKLGFSFDIVQYVTNAPPEGMTWLHAADAKRLGITYSLLDDKPDEEQTFVPGASRQQQAPAPTVSATPVVPQADPSPAARAVQVVVNSYAVWSQGGVNVEPLAAYYNANVNYFGKMVPREQVMVEKRKFSARWPVRHYTVNPSNLIAQCDADGACAVTGTIGWDCTSQERNEHSVGTAQISLRILNGVIYAENGSVVSGHKEPIGGSDVTAPGYVQGRQARINYEAWYASLPEGPYKAGVTYWASHRSDKVGPPNCYSGPADWAAGCLAGRTNLAPIDAQRNADKDFWYGWNSL
jgi:hypothetical protein